jgi:hypothetical protein
MTMHNICFSEKSWTFFFRDVVQQQASHILEILWGISLSRTTKKASEEYHLCRKCALLSVLPGFSWFPDDVPREIVGIATFLALTVICMIKVTEPNVILLFLYCSSIQSLIIILCS